MHMSVIAAGRRLAARRRCSPGKAYVVKSEQLARWWSIARGSGVLIGIVFSLPICTFIAKPGYRPDAFADLCAAIGTVTVVLLWSAWIFVKPAAYCALDRVLHLDGREEMVPPPELLDRLGAAGALIRIGYGYGRSEEQLVVLGHDLHDAARRLRRARLDRVRREDWAELCNAVAPWVDLTIRGGRTKDATNLDLASAGMRNVSAFVLEWGVDPWERDLRTLSDRLEALPHEVEQLLTRAYTLARAGSDELHPDQSLYEFGEIEFTVETGGHWLLWCETPAVAYATPGEPRGASIEGLAYLSRPGRFGVTIALDFGDLANEATWKTARVIDEW